MTVMILGGFFKALSREIEEAACIDGCNIFNMFFRIIFPMIRPGIATSCIFAFLNTWNELLFANTFVDDTIDKAGRKLYQPVQPVITRSIKKICRSIKSKRTGYIYN